MVNNSSRRAYRKCREQRRQEGIQTEWRITYTQLQRTYGSEGIRRLFDDRRDGF